MTINEWMASKKNGAVAATAFDGRQVELRQQRMLKRLRVHAAVVPPVPVRAEVRCELGDALLEGGLDFGARRSTFLVAARLVDGAAPGDVDSGRHAVFRQHRIPTRHHRTRAFDRRVG